MAEARANNFAITIIAFELSHFQQSQRKNKSHIQDKCPRNSEVFTTTMATGVAIATAKSASRLIS
jgi:hypothetical protein